MGWQPIEEQPGDTRVSEGTIFGPKNHYRLQIVQLPTVGNVYKLILRISNCQSHSSPINYCIGLDKFAANNFLCPSNQKQHPTISEILKTDFSSSTVLELKKPLLTLRNRKIMFYLFRMKICIYSIKCSTSTIKTFNGIKKLVQNSKFVTFCSQLCHRAILLNFKSQSFWAPKSIILEKTSKCPFQFCISLASEHLRLLPK